MNRTEIERRTAAFDRWHYELDLRGVRTPIFDEGHRNRHLQRKAYFFDPLVEWCGGSLSGHRVLDLGCNAGYWSLLAAEAGADFVLGVDRRPAHIDQAKLVFEARDVQPNRYSFRQANVFDLDLTGERFDVVLCLGFMYHVAKPVELMELISSWSDDLLVIDTAISRLPGRAFEFEGESPDEPRDSVDFSFALWPTRSALLELLEQFGYRTAVREPSFTSWEGCADYRSGFRRAFLCTRRTPLGTLGSEKPDRFVIGRDIAARAGLTAWRWWQRRTGARASTAIRRASR